MAISFLSELRKSLKRTIASYKRKKKKNCSLNESKMLEKITKVIGGSSVCRETVGPTKAVVYSHAIPVLMHSCSL